MVKFLLLCASVAIQASHAGATASLRTDRGQLIFDLGSNITSDAEASIRVIRGSEEVCTVQRTTCILSLILFNLHLTIWQRTCASERSSTCFVHWHATWFGRDAAMTSIACLLSKECHCNYFEKVSGSTWCWQCINFMKLCMNTPPLPKPRSTAWCM